jgi:hypothetical protein
MTLNKVEVNKSVDENMFNPAYTTKKTEASR